MRKIDKHACPWYCVILLIPFLIMIYVISHSTISNDLFEGS